MGEINIVYQPPSRVEDRLYRVHDLQVSLEDCLLSSDMPQYRDPEDHQSFMIEAPPRPGALAFLERMALGDRTRVWIDSCYFGRFGSMYVEVIKGWLSAHGLAPDMLKHIGFTNILLAHSFIMSPRVFDKAPPAMVAGIVEERYQSIRDSERYREQKVE